MIHSGVFSSYPVKKPLLVLLCQSEQAPRSEGLQDGGLRLQLATCTGNSDSVAQPERWIRETAGSDQPPS